MSSMLDTIINTKRKEVAEAKELVPVKKLEKSAHFDAPTLSLKSYLARPDRVGVIAEIKRRSPSKGDLNPHISVQETSIGYMQAGASALSILTDKSFFGAKAEDLPTARKFNLCPILRKEFVVDEYQIVEARSLGADVILLLANVLTPEELRSFTATAHGLGLEVLVEVHDKSELDKVPFEAIDLIGVNNRDLGSFTVSLDTSLGLIKEIPASLTKISESGIHSAEDLLRLKHAGYQGFLIGELFMRAARPAEACAELIKDVQKRGYEQTASH